MRTIDEIAQDIYERAQANAAAWQRAGIEPRAGSVEAASLPMIRDHVEACQALQRQYHVTMEPTDSRLWGQTAEQLQETARGRNRQMAGRRGKKVLVRRYGGEIAEEIIDRAKTTRRSK